MADGTLFLSENTVLSEFKHSLTKDGLLSHKNEWEELPFKVRAYACGLVKNRDLCVLSKKDDKIWMVRVAHIDEPTCPESDSECPCLMKKFDVKFKSFEGPEKMKLLDSNNSRFFAVGESNTVYTWETKVVMEDDVTVHKMDGFETIPVSKSL